MPFIDTFQTLREQAGLRKAEVATHSKVSVDTVTRVEKHMNASKETLIKIINALNELYFDRVGKSVDPEIVISDRSKFGEGKTKINKDAINAQDEQRLSQIIKFGKSDV